MFTFIVKASLSGYLLLGLMACGDHLPLSGGALTGDNTMLYCLGQNPAAGENCLHFSIFDQKTKFL